MSIVMPCYNAAETVQEALDSIRRQTYTDWELIAVDDGSADETRHALKQAASEDDRIRVVSMEHGGVVAASQRGCAEARGSLLARMDADDVAHPDKFAAQVRYLDAHDTTVACGTKVRIVGDEVGSGYRRYEAWVNSVLTPKQIAREAFVECTIPHSTLLMRRDAFEVVGGYEDHGWPEDYDLVLRYYAAGYRVGKSPGVLLDWRNSPNRLSRIDAQYGPEMFRACKRHYLLQTYLEDDPPFYQWGAGEVGKAWLREWEHRLPEAVVDLDPRKVGKLIHGTLVIYPRELPAPNEAFTVVAVGAPGAREDIRKWFTDGGYEEMRDYVFVA